MAITFKVQLVGITKPPVWRRFAIPNNATFYDLHRAIQVAFGWEDCHLWCFHGAKRMRNGWRVVSDYFDGEEGPSPGTSLCHCGLPIRFYYTYDFGDNWLHSIKIEQADDEKVDGWHFIDSKGEDPQEDMGGVYGYLAYRAGEHPWNEAEE